MFEICLKYVLVVEHGSKLADYSYALKKKVIIHILYKDFVRSSHLFVFKAIYHCNICDPICENPPNHRQTQLKL